MNIGKVGMHREEDEQRQAAVTRNEKQHVRCEIVDFGWDYSEASKASIDLFEVTTAKNALSVWFLNYTEQKQNLCNSLLSLQPYTAGR